MIGSPKLIRSQCFAAKSSSGPLRTNTGATLPKSGILAKSANFFENIGRECPRLFTTALQSNSVSAETIQLPLGQAARFFLG